MRKLNAKLLLGLLLGSLVGTGAVFAVHHFQYGRIAESLLWQARRAEEQGQVRRQARYLQQYLEFNRKDLAVKAQLGRLWAGEEFADSPRDRLRAVRLLDDVLAQGDDDADLRRLLVKTALDVRQLKTARNHLEKLLSRDFLEAPAEAAGAGAARGEAEGYAGRLLEYENQPEKALACYRLAVRHAPQARDNYVALARLLRKQERPSADEREEARREADRAVDALVKNNPLAHEAYLERWRYRRDFRLITFKEKPADGEVRLADAAGDVAQALRRAPESVDVLLAAADLERLEAQAAAAGSGTPEEKEKERREHRDKALALLDQGLKVHARAGKSAASDLPQFRLLWQRASLLLDDIERVDLAPAAADAKHRAEWVADVNESIARLRKTRGEPAATDLLQARLHVLNRRWAEAVTLLEQLRPTLGAQPELAGPINRYLGQCYEQLVEPGQMFKAFERMQETDAGSPVAMLGMAQAEWMMGHLDRAAELFGKLAAARQLPSRTWIDFARLEIQRQAAQERPDWSLVEKLCVQAGRENPDAVEVPLLTAQMEMARDPQTLGRARQVLAKAQKDKGWTDNADLWAARVLLELRDRKPEPARELLAEAKAKLGPRVVQLRLAEARLLVEEDRKGAEAAVNRLADDAGQFTKEEDRARLLGGLADVQMSLDNAASARRLWRRVAELPARKADLPLHLLLFDLAARADDEAGMRQALDDIRALEGDRGPFHRYGEALRLIARAKKAQGEERQPLLDEASSHLERVHSLRPTWAPLFVARAQVARLADRKDQAIADLQQAVGLGETGPAVLRDLVELLAAAGRYDEADAALRNLREPLLANSALGRLAAGIAAQRKDMDRANRLYDLNRGEGTRNWRELLWQGRMAAETNRPEEAEKRLRAARELADREPEPYVALVQFYARQKRDREADAVLEQARQRLPAGQVELTLGQCYEILGRKKSAQDRYEKALSGQRRNAAVVRRVAAFYWGAGQLADAEPLLRDLVEKRVQEPSADDVNWARRHLALVLAGGTDYGRFREAMGLVGLKLDDNGQLVRDAPRERNDGTETRRFQARVLASQASHRQFRARALELLEDLERHKALRPDDRFILALLYEGEGGWQKARPILAELAGLKEPAPRHLAYYVQALIDHKDLEEAGRQVERLEALEFDRGSEPNAFAAVELRARLLEENKNGDKAVRLLEDHIGRKNAHPDEVLLLLHALMRQRKFAEAYDRCLRAWADHKCSPEVVGGASVAVLRGMQLEGAAATREQVLRVENHLKRALEANPKSVVLMLHLAQLYDQRGDWAMAEQMYRDVLRPENEPRNIVALNNLAWLLAQRSSDEQKMREALERIEAAVNGFGRRADLMDTRGLVRLKLNQPAEALADFREAAADLPTPAHLFHLARAHYQARDKAAAARALKDAQDQGLRAEVLHPAEQDDYQRLLNDLRIR